MMKLLLAQSLLLSGGTVHSMEADQAPRVADVSIEDGHIAAIGPVGSLPATPGARTIDATGRHVVPGLIDGMVHHDPDHDLLYLSAGVTLVRDAGNQVGRVLMERRPDARDLAPGPALFVAGPVLDGDPPSTTEAAVLRNAHEVDVKLAPLFEAGIDYLSFHEGLPRDAWERLLTVAHQRGLQVWGPAPHGVELADLTEKAQDGLFGLQGLLPSGRTWREIATEDVLAAVAMVQSSKLRITPLVGVYARVLAARDESRLAWLSPHYEIGWRAEGEAWTEGVKGEVRALTERALAVQLAALKRLHDGGTSLVPGSAAPNSWLAPGDALHDELDQWVEAGIEPYEVLRLTTAGAAEALGLAGRGRLAPGDVADVLIVDGDPRDSLAGLRRPAVVVLRGRALERAEIDAKLAELSVSLARVRAELERPIEVAPPSVPDGDTILAGRAVVEAYGRPVSAERFQVVRTYDGRTAFCTRLRIPDTATKQGSELHLVQRYYEGRLEGFDLRVVAGEEYTVEGRLIGGLMNVQRRLGEQVIDSKRAREPISLVDVSSVLTPMLIAQQFVEGPSFVLMFRGLDTATDRWWLQLDEADHRHNVKTSDGWLVAGLDERGVPLFQIRRAGNAQTVLRVEEAQAFGGPGLGLDAARVFVEQVEAAEANGAAEASAEVPGVAPPRQGVPAPEGDAPAPEGDTSTPAEDGTPPAEDGSPPAEDVADPGDGARRDG